MYKLLLKYNFITIIPFSETFFYTALLPKKLKLTKELLYLNYSKLSPFKNPHIVISSSKNKIMLWFCKNSFETKINVPESFLAYKALSRSDKDIMYVIKGDVYKILIIKEGLLLNAFTLESMDALTVQLTMDEYKVSITKELSEEEYKELLKKAQQSITLSELYQFSEFALDRKELLTSIVSKMSYPLSGLILFAIFISYMQENFLESKISKLETIYKNEKRKNRDITEYIKEHNAQVKKWNSFVEKELVYVGPSILLEQLYSIFKEDEKAYLIDVRINADKLLIKIQTNLSPVTLLNRLNEIKYFKRVVIQNTHKPRNAMKIISYDIEVKKIKEL